MSSYVAPGNVLYNYAQLEGIWLQAGGQPGAAPIAAAIAMAESGGNTTATNQDSNGTVDRGLWQINSVHGAQSTYDVMGNARAAVAISNNGQNWAPWTTYGSDAYQKFLQANVPPDTSTPINATNAAANQNTGTLTGDNLAFSLPGGIWDPANWFLNPFGSAASAGAGAIQAVGPTLIKIFLQGVIITMLNPMIQLAAGVMGIGAGAGMVAIGFWMIARNTETGQQVERGAGFAAQTALTAAAPETRATTLYRGAGGTTAVTQARRPAGKVGRFQYRPAQVQTTVERPPPNTRQQLVNESQGYVNKPNSDSGGRKLSPTTSSTHRTYRGPGGAGGRGGSSGR